MRDQMGEACCTILGHFRHESGHDYRDRLIHESEWLQPCRELFGDDSRDYAQALDEHYQNGPPTDWREHFVSACASTHLWQDRAERWAHYLLIVGTLETVYAYGFRIRPGGGEAHSLTVQIDFNPYRKEDFDTLIEY